MLEPPECVRPPHSRRDERHAEPAGSRAQRPLVDALARLHRVDHLAHGQRTQDGRRAADVVAVRVGRHERGERVESHAAELPVDMRLGRPGVDEHRALRRLEQDRVALADVEKRDAQARRAATTRRRMQRPPADREERHECDGRGNGRAAAVRRERPQQAAAERAPRQYRRRPCETTSARYGSDAIEARRERDPRGGEPRRARRARPPRAGSPERARRTRDRSRAGRASRAPRAHSPAPSRAGSCRTGARESAPWRCRRRPRSPPPRRARSGSGIALLPALQPRHRDEDRGDRGERELEARLEQRPRRPREQHDRAHRHRVPAVARTREQPRQRREAARHGRPHDRRLPARPRARRRGSRGSRACDRSSGRARPRTRARARRSR